MGRREQQERRQKDPVRSQADEAPAPKRKKASSWVIEPLITHLEHGDTKGYVLPIISNSIRTDWILDGDFNEKLGLGDEFHGKLPDLANLEQEQAQNWADSFGYPYGIRALPESLKKLQKDNPGILDDGQSGNDLVDQLTRVVRDLRDNEIQLRQVAQYNHLARVAQYRQLVLVDYDSDPGSPDFFDYSKERANEDYLSFLKQTLLDEIAREDRTIPKSYCDELQVLIEEGYSFSDLAQDLGYPRFNKKHPDILRMLAQLPARIYITTSYYNFLERLLQAEGRQPQTQICFFKGEPETALLLPEHRTNHQLEPSINNPVVYHLYGFERYPASLVMSESDYVDFLIAMAQDTNSKKPIIPLYIRQALAGSILLLLGYRLQDWDFRVLIRSLLLQETGTKFNVALQLNPDDQENIQNRDQAKRYLKQYFKSVNFAVVLSRTVEFVRDLHHEWKKRKPGNGGHY